MRCVMNWGYLNLTHRHKCKICNSILNRIKYVDDYANIFHWPYTSNPTDLTQTISDSFQRIYIHRMPEIWKCWSHQHVAKTPQAMQQCWSFSSLQIWYEHLISKGNRSNVNGECASSYKSIVLVCYCFYPCLVKDYIVVWHRCTY